MRDLYIKEVIRDFKNIQNLKDSVKNLENKLYEIDQELTGLHAIKYDAMPKAAGKPNTRAESLILEKDNIQSKINRTIHKINCLEEVLEQLDKSEKKIVYDLIISPTAATDLLYELNISKSELYRQKDEILYKLSVKLFGVDAL